MRKFFYFLTIVLLFIFTLAVETTSFAFECVGPIGSNCLACHIRADIHNFHWEDVGIVDCTECHCGEPGTSNCDRVELTQEPVETQCCLACHSDCYHVNSHTYRPPPDDFNCGSCHFPPGMPGNCSSDIDLDDFPDDSDNCPDHPNGPLKGTCTKIIAGNYIVSNGQYCIDDGDCDEGEYCEKEQADHYPPGGNGIGDACDCEGDFDCSGGVDAGDVGPFLDDWNKRTIYSNPCTNEDPCTGDFNCSRGVDAGDVGKFLEDWNKRTIYSNSCPACAGGSYQPWCVYPE